MFSGELFDVLDETVKKKTINVSKKVKVQEINHKRLSSSKLNELALMIMAKC